MKRFWLWYLELSIYYQLIPFLLLYLTICIVFAPNQLVGDEGRYVGFANNLLNGFYSPPYPDIQLESGPGYPLFLAIFLLFKVPLIVIRLLNGILLYLSLIIIHKTCSIFVSRNKSFIFTVLIGLYWPIFISLPLLHTEIFAWFTISLACYLVIKTFEQNFINWKLLILSAFTIAYLAMIKVIFGHVIIIMLSVSLLMLLFARFRKMAKKSAIIFLISFLFCLPYLFYTYSLTGKFLYWTNLGNQSLYTMSSPYENEYGDWSPSWELQKNPNHALFVDSILKLEPLERDEAYKKAAIENIRSHPKKFTYNWIANIGRILFSYPYSYKDQSIRTYFILIPQIFVVVFLVLTLPLWIIHYKRFPEGFNILFLFILVYLAGSSLVSAYPRMFSITMPLWVFYFSYVFDKLVSVKVIKDNRINNYQ